MRIKILLLCLALLLALASCAPSQTDFFAPFQGGFTAWLVGEWQGIAFEAKVMAAAPDESGTRGMTLTFYAPSTLCGTVLSKDATGELRLASGELSLPLSGDAAEGYGALFALFPTSGEVLRIARENENTRLDGADISLLFSPDGTPLAAENAGAHVRIERFER